MFVMFELVWIFFVFEALWRHSQLARASL